eukprot:TRINITY_DN5592_c1_g1_i2.p1 TRINITY_DN5592_c1_g1~~TRINITY_DN5592_c1_g1_i2.p1  ORF type:complete len:2641 (+),score=780.53 TRINITY_DN5592_c1_g1_i2:1138-7923(+)
MDELACLSTQLERILNGAKDDGSTPELEGVSVASAPRRGPFKASKKKGSKGGRRGPSFSSSSGPTDIMSRPTDVTTYMGQLWKTMTGLADILTRRSKDIVQIFLSFYDQEYVPMTAPLKEGDDYSMEGDGEGEGDEDEDEREEEDEGEEDEDVEGAKGRGSGGKKGRSEATGVESSTWRDVNGRLGQFLTFFSEVDRPQQLHQAPRLQGIFQDLLLKADPRVQALSFKCYMTWRPKDIMPYKTIIEKLIDEDTMRETMTSFHFDHQGMDLQQGGGGYMKHHQDGMTSSMTTLAPEHRMSVANIIVRVMYGKLFSRPAKFKGSPEARRSTLLTYIANMSPEELAPFFDLVFASFAGIVRSVREGVDKLKQETSDAKSSTAKNKKARKTNDVVDTPAPLLLPEARRQIGFLHLFQAIIKQMGTHVASRLSEFFSLLLAILRTVLPIGSDTTHGTLATPIHINGANVEGICPFAFVPACVQGGKLRDRQATQLRIMCYRRLFQMINVFHSSELSFVRLAHTLVTLTAPTLVVTDPHGQHGYGSAISSALMQTFLLMGKDHLLRPLLFTHPDLFPRVVSLLPTPSMQPGVIMLLESLLTIDKETLARQRDARLARLEERKEERIKMKTAQKHAETNEELEALDKHQRHMATLISPHIHAILSALEAALGRKSIAAVDAAKKRKTRGLNMLSFAIRRMLRILATLAPRLQLSAHSNMLVSMLMPFVKYASESALVARALDEARVETAVERAQRTAAAAASSGDETIQLLSLSIHDTIHNLIAVIARILPNTSNPESYFYYLSSLFETIHIPQNRILLCQVFDVYAHILSSDPHMAIVAKLLNDLHTEPPRATLESLTSGPDRRLECFASLNEKHIRAIPVGRLVPVLFVMLHMMRDSPEMSMRNNACFTLVQFVHRVSAEANTSASAIIAPVEAPAKVPKKDRGFASSVLPARPEPAATSRDDGVHFVRSALVASVREVLKRPYKLNIRGPFLKLLGEIVQSLPGLLPDLVPLLPRAHHIHDTHEHHHHHTKTQPAQSTQPKGKGKDKTKGKGKGKGMMKGRGKGKGKGPKTKLPLAVALEEVNFFQDISDPQTHHQRRALYRLVRVARAQPFAASTLDTLILPLLNRMVLELDNRTIRQKAAKKDYHYEKGGKGKRPVKVMNKNPVKINTFLDTLIATIGRMGRYMSWRSYSMTLARYLKLVRSSHALQRVAVGIVCSLVDNFRFGVDTTSGDPDDVIDGVPVASARVSDPASVARARDGMLRQFLPDMYELLSSKKSDEVLHAQVAVAIVKLLKRYSSEKLEKHVPKLVQVLGHGLKKREDNVRKITRRTLGTVLRLLGPQYLRFVLQELKGILRYGYQIHVLSFTVHYLLRTLSFKTQPGLLDNSMDVLMEIFLEDILGQSAEQKDVAEIAKKLKEARGIHSFHSLEIVVSKIDFKATMGVIMKPLLDAMSTSRREKLATRVNEMLGRIAKGLFTNATLDIPALLVFLHQLISKNLFATSQKTAPTLRDSHKYAKPLRASPDDRFLVQADPAKQRDAAVVHRQYATHSHMLGEFALRVFYEFTKHNKFNIKDPLHAQMLDPFVELLGRCIHSPFSQAQPLAIKSLGLVLSVPLPSVTQDMVSNIMRDVFSLMQKQSGRDDLSRTCMRVVATVLRDCKGFTPLDVQLQVILRIATQDLDNTKKLPQTLALIKVIISRRLAVPEVYDLMNDIAKLMIRNPGPAVRRQSAKLLLEFMMFYPMTEAKHRHYLLFIVNNMSYEFVSGREAALEMMNRVIHKFPRGILDKHGVFVFLPLVERLVNDQEPLCRQMVGGLLKELVKTVSPAVADQMMEMVGVWYAPQKQNNNNDVDSDDDDNNKEEGGQSGSSAILRRAAAQLIGIFSESMDRASFEPHLQRLVPSVIANLQTTLQDAAKLVQDMQEAHEGTEPDLANTPEAETWPIAYYTLHSLEKVFQHNPSTPVSLFGSVWSMLSAFLEHPHGWVRLAASRLLGVYLAHNDPAAIATQLAPTAGSGPYKGFLVVPGEIFLLARRLCALLAARGVTEEVGRQVIKNLLFLGQVFFRCHFPLPGGKQDQDQDQNDDEDEKDEKEKEKEDKNRGNSPALYYLFQRMSFIARGSSTPANKAAVFKWFAAMVNQLPTPEDVTPFLDSIITPMFRHAAQPERAPEGLGPLSKQVLGLVEAKMGPTAYFQVFDEIRRRLVGRQEERKRKRKIEKVVDPEGTAAKRRELKLRRKLERQKRPKRVTASSRVLYGTGKWRDEDADGDE